VYSLHDVVVAVGFLNARHRFHLGPRVPAVLLSGPGSRFGNVGCVGYRNPNDIAVAGFATEGETLAGVEDTVLNFIQGKDQPLAALGAHEESARGRLAALVEWRKNDTPEIWSLFSKCYAVEMESGSNSQLAENSRVDLQVERNADREWWDAPSMRVAAGRH
jgi:hypothetical protein